MLRRVALVKTDVLEERITSIIRVTRIGVLETLAVISNRSTQRYLQEPYGVTFQMTPLFSVSINLFLFMAILLTVQERWAIGDNCIMK
jgi:hypothetical protein